jgi:glutamate-1-semialdehyde 2,1-aminomutase
VFILDEMITGFRWHLKGAQHVYGVTPDLCTFGKAMANGFSVAAVCGKRELMQLGAIDSPGTRRLFLLSTTHGAEMSGLGAFIRTVKFLQDHEVIPQLWRYGASVVRSMNALAAEYGIADHFKAAGPMVNPYYLTFDRQGRASLELRTLFAQEMIKNGVLMPWLAFSYRHGDAELQITEAALRSAFQTIRRALDDGVGKYLVGPAIRPVFREFN